MPSSRPGRSPRRSRSSLSLVAASILLLLAGRVAAQPSGPLVLSWRVGATIDSLEQQYFGLWSGIAGFRAARAVADGDQVAITIERAGRTDTTLALPRTSFEELGRFVDRIEGVLDGTVAIDWDRMPAVRTSRPFGEGREIEVERFDGGLVEGRLATIDDRGLSIWRGAGTYDPSRLDAELVVLPLHEIGRVQSGSSFWLGAAAGASLGGAIGGYAHSLGHEPPISLSGVGVSTVVTGLIGGVIGSLTDVATTVDGNAELYAEVPARLSRHVMFHLVAPPELRARVDSLLEPHRGVSMPVAAVGAASIASGNRLGVNLSASIGPTFAIGSSTYPVTMSFNRRSEGELQSGAIAWRAEASYDLAPWLSLGVGVVRRSAVRSDTTVDAEWTSSLEPVGIVELNLTPYGIQRRRVEVVAGIGAGVMSLTHTAQLPSGSGGSRRLFESTHSSPLGFGRLLVVLNASSRLAVHSGLEARFAPSISIPTYSYRDDPRPEWRFKWVDEHEVTMSTLELQLGARFRF